MEDRLNFRFWHELEKRWFYFNFNNFDMYQERIQKYCLDDGKQIYQSTGLKDKNGKLIYEGDILKVNTGGRDTSGYGVVEYFQSGCKFVVNGFLENPSGFYERKKGEFFRPLEQWLRTEIIGNIYENPELLEAN